MKKTLSVLDLCPVVGKKGASAALRNTLALAQHTEALGYARYWVAEHHDARGIASSCPEVVIAHIAQATRSMRVGSGGVMLPNHASLRIAEAFLTLEAFHPGRIDLGIGRAPGTNPRAAMALRGGADPTLGADHFPEQIAELDRYFKASALGESPAGVTIAMPFGVSSPEIWVLGSSDYGARLAGRLGLPYAFAQHFSTLPLKGVIDLYRSSFKPSATLAEPKVIVAVHAICADTDAEATELSLPTEYSMYHFRRTGRSEPLLTVSEVKALGLGSHEWDAIRASAYPKFVGSPTTLQKKFDAVLGPVDADEWMILSMIPDFSARLKSYELLAKAFAE